MSTVTYAVAYARVSKEDQAIKNLSVPAQFRRIEEYCQKNNIVIVYRDADEGVSSFKDNVNREGFERAVEAACRDKRVTLFLIDDSARFYRDSYRAGATKARLRRHGVRVLITSNPYDVTTIAGKWMEKIDEAKDETSSMMTGFYTFRGQEQNIQTRDEITGWCYKNGGKAPFGYRTVKVVRGRDPRGRDIIKALWEIDEEAAEVLRYYYRELKLKRQLSHHAAHRELNRLKLSGPTPGKPWTISSVITMMQEDRILQCAGVAIWNKEDHKTPGRRFKPKEEWIFVENAHPAIITMEEAQALLKLKKERAYNAKWGRTEDSDWLLVGKNVINEDFFVCLACGTRMSSHQPSPRNRKCYLCGNARYRGPDACIHKPVDKLWLEEYLLKVIKEHFGTNEAAQAIAKKFNQALKEESSAEIKALTSLEQAIHDYDKKIKNLVQAVADGLDISEVKEEIQRLKEEQKNSQLELDRLRDEINASPQEIHPEDILNMYSRLELAFQDQSNREKKKLLRYFIRKIEFSPDDDRLTVYLFADPTSTKAVWFSFGAQDGACIVCHNVSQKRP